MSLPLGKVPIEILRRILKYANTDKSVIVGPGVGIDAAIISVEKKIIASACDPITGASKDIGWLSVHVNANDIASVAADPRWYVVVLLFPKNATEEQIYEVMDGIKKGLVEVGASLVAGHTELTDKVTDTIVVGTMMGIPMVNNKFVSNKNARPGDYIIMTKGAGIEGTWILSEALGEKLDLDDRIIQNIKKLKSKISVLPDVRAIVNVGVDNIHALHDATEGGLIGALFEIADASNVGFTVDESKIIVLEETRKIASKLAIDPLRLISSGTLIAVVDKDVAEEALSMLKKEDITAEIIGKITEDKKIIRRIDGRSEEIKKPSVDELWRVLSEIR